MATTSGWRPGVFAISDVTMCSLPPRSEMSFARAEHSWRPTEHPSLQASSERCRRCTVCGHAGVLGRTSRRSLPRPPEVHGGHITPNLTDGAAPDAPLEGPRSAVQRQGEVDRETLQEG